MCTVLTGTPDLGLVWLINGRGKGRMFTTKKMHRQAHSVIMGYICSWD